MALSLWSHVGCLCVDCVEASCCCCRPACLLLISLCVSLSFLSCCLHMCVCLVEVIAFTHSLSHIKHVPSLGLSSNSSSSRLLVSISPCLCPCIGIYVSSNLPFRALASFRLTRSRQRRQLSQDHTTLPRVVERVIGSHRRDDDDEHGHNDRLKPPGGKEE